MGSTTVAGALTGLLFVALSVGPERFRGVRSSAETQAVAATAFTSGSGLAAMSDAVTLVFVFFGVGLARAWELLGLQGGGLLDLLATSVRQAVTGEGPEPEHADGPRPERGAEQ